MSRAADVLRALAALLLPWVLHACTGENVTEVSVSEVEVSPPAVSAVVGESVRLSVVVRDELGEELSGVSPLWSSDDPSIAEVDAGGLVQARSSGRVVVRATYEGVSGTSDVRIFPGPGIETSTDSVALVTAEGRPPPQAQVVHLTNEGTGALEGLRAEVRHPEGDPAWLRARLDGSTAPTSVRLSADSEELPAGVYAASVAITASTPDIPPVEIPVTLRVAGVVVGATGGGSLVSESASTDSLLVALGSAPVSDVVLRVTSEDPGEATVSPTRLTFTPSTWNDVRAVVVTGVDDAAVDGDEETTITFTVEEDSSDPAYDLIAELTARVTTSDDDEAGLAVSESGGSTVVTEAGGLDEITVALTAQPASDVELEVTSADPGEVTASPDRLIFTPDDWSAPRTVTVEGVDDGATDGDQVTLVTISVDAGASDAGYDAAEDRTVSVTTTDDDVAGVSVSQSGGSTIVDESGTTDEITVVLTAAPAGVVVFDVTSADPLEVAVLPSRLAFTPDNWSSPQIVTVRGVDDASVDGDQTTTVTVAVDPAASDDAFDAVPAHTVAVTTTDNDAAGLSVIESGGGTVVEEGGATDSFVVALSAAPTVDVVVDVSSGDPAQATVAPPRLTFTPTTWSTAQTVTVTAVDDVLTDGDQVTTVTVSVDPAASDDLYDGAPDATVSVAVEDDDAAGLAVSESGGSSTVSEDGVTDELSVALMAEPASEVSLNVTSADPEEVTVSPTRLTFTGASWGTPQSVTMTGAEEPVVDGDQTTVVTISVDAAASDDAFDAVPAVGVDVTTLDDDVAGLAVVESEGATEMLEGGTDTFTAALLAAPLTPVVLSVSSGDVSVATVSPALLTFTSADWSQPRVVTTTGTEDLVVDGSQVTTVTIALVAAASDEAFRALPDATVSVTTHDNDGGGDADD